LCTQILDGPAAGKLVPGEILGGEQRKGVHRRKMAARKSHPPLVRTITGGLWELPQKKRAGTMRKVHNTPKRKLKMPQEEIRQNEKNGVAGLGKDFSGRCLKKERGSRCGKKARGAPIPFTPEKSICKLIREEDGGGGQRF